MVTPTASETEQLRHELQSEREQLASAVAALRTSTSLSQALRARLPLVLAGAFASGFVLSGGIGATVRLVLRRRREGRETARVGRFALVSRE
jgi:hypothetical protein